MPWEHTPILVEAKVNARWSLDFVHDQFALGRRFRILNIVDDVTRECLAIPDTSISGRRIARELTAIMNARAKPGMIVSDKNLSKSRCECGGFFGGARLIDWLSERRAVRRSILKLGEIPMKG